MINLISLCLAHVKTLVTNLVAIGMAVAAIYAVTLPDTSAFDSAEWKAVKLGNNLLVIVEIPKQTRYSAEVHLYAGNGEIGSINIPSGGQRSLDKTFALPPSAVNQADLTITAYWRVHSWNDVISPTELYIRVPVEIPGS